MCSAKAYRNTVGQELRRPREFTARRVRRCINVE